MSAPARQRSLRERIQSASRGIGISWQGKKSKSYHSKESLAEAQTSEGDASNTEKQDPKPEQNRVPDSSAANEEGDAIGVGVEKKPLGRTLTQPQGTEQYQVAENETLAGIAARFDTTPSELAKLNRLAARIVFPGQLLYVPEKKNRGGDTGEEAETSDSLIPPQSGQEDRRPSVTDNLRIPYRRASERAHRFLKVKARHFTDGMGVVCGVLIITPNAVMFDPNVSDPLVIEHGVESYGVIAPLDMLMRAAIYFDIAHMKVQHAPEDTRPKAEVYFGKMMDATEESFISHAVVKTPSIEVAPPIDTPPTTPVKLQEPPLKQEVIEEEPTPPTEQEDKLNPEKPTETPPASAIVEDPSESFDEEVSDAFAAAEAQAPSESRRERMLKRLSYPMESITSISRILTSSPKSFVDFSGSLFSSTSRGSEDEPIPEEGEQQRFSNLVEEKPEIFEALDKLLKKQKEETEGPPLYLCLRMGTPKERKPQPSPVLSYGKKRARSEYWFSIPRSRVEDLYNFLQQWVPHLYGDVDDIDPDAAGFIPIDDSQPDQEEEEEAKQEDGEEKKDEEEKQPPRSFLSLVEEHLGFKSISPGDWEVLSLGDMEGFNLDIELPLPELLEPSEILTEEHIKELFNNVPNRAKGYPWTRIYSTSKDGFNLKSLYRKMANYDCPVLLIIQDTEHAVFGALLSHPLRPSDKFYGTGESFLFTFYPSFKDFKWTGENDYFISGNTDSVSIGASDGHFGLWFDGDLNRGSSTPCLTFSNEVLASGSDFQIHTLEAWGFN